MSDTKPIHAFGTFVLNPNSTLGKYARENRLDRTSNPFQAIADRADAVDGLARLLDQGLERGLSADGRLDLRVVAAFVLDEMSKHQKEGG